MSSPSAGAAPSGHDVPVRIPVDLRRFPWFTRLATDYAFDFRAVAPFYAGDPSTHQEWIDAIRRAQAHGRPSARVAEILGAQQERRGAPARAREAARRLADPRAVAIVTGQQAGLFGGPLFTLLKALTAVKLADHVTHVYGVPAVAVFWIDGEDHDWEEVRSCAVFDADLEPRTVSLPDRTANPAAPVASVRLDDQIVTALDALQAALPKTDFTDSLLADLRRIYTPGAGMAEAFAQWLEHVLGDRGLVVYDASDPATKPLVAPIFVHELTTRGEAARLAAATGADMVARGYHAQVQMQDGSLALFRLDGARRPIRFHEDGFLVDDHLVGADALVDDAHTKPGGFSPNVLLRPLVQDTLFPTVCYVPGPSEIAYLGQLGRVYSTLGIPMPLLYPRATATLVDSAALRFLAKYNVPLEALKARDESALNTLLSSQIPSEIERSLADAGTAVDAAMARVVAAMPLLDATLERTAQSTLGRMQHDLQTLHGKTIQAAKRRDDTLRRQFMRVRAMTFPGGDPQERAVGFVSFLNQYGPSLVDRLEEELPLDLGYHWVVAI